MFNSVCLLCNNLVTHFTVGPSAAFFRLAGPLLAFLLQARYLVLWQSPYHAEYRAQYTEIITSKTLQNVNPQGDFQA